MKSTGEVMGVADGFGLAFAKAQLAAGQPLPSEGRVFFSLNNQDKPHHAAFVTKAIHARNYGAKAVVIVNGRLGQGQQARECQAPEL